MFVSSCCEYSRVLHLWTSLHPNAYLYSGVVVRAGADKAFGASIHRPWGIAISSLVDLHGAKSLPRQTGPGPGHGDIWLVCGSGAGCQGCRQHSSWTLAWALQLPCFNQSILASSCGHSSTWIWLHRSYFQPAHCCKSSVLSRDKEETRKKLPSKLFEEVLNGNSTGVTTGELKKLWNGFSFAWNVPIACKIIPDIQYSRMKPCSSAK